MSTLGTINRAYVRLWMIPLIYFGLIGVDIFFKSMGWGSMVIFMLVLFLFLGFFVLLQPSILCAVFLIKSLDEWSIEAGWRSAKFWITKQVPAVVYLVLVIPLTITLLPIERFLGLSVIGLVVYWMAEMAGIRYAEPRSLIILRVIHWGIIGYLALAGLYNSPLGERIVNESPAIQHFLARNNPFIASEAQKVNNAVLKEIRETRTEKLAACVKLGIENARSKGDITDPHILDRINRECDQSAGLTTIRESTVSKAVLVHTSSDPCIKRNIDRVNGTVYHTEEVFDVILNGCRKNKDFAYPLATD